MDTQAILAMAEGDGYTENVGFEDIDDEGSEETGSGGDEGQSDDDGEDQHEEESGNTEAKENRLSGNKRDHRGNIALPTFEEQKQLRETGDVFRSNLLALELEELLKEVRVESSKKASARIKEWLFSLKEFLETLKPCNVTEKSIDKKSFELSHYLAHEISLDFSPPSKFDIVGSYLLNTLAKPVLSIDLAIEMPSSCFAPKDVVNHRYFDRRALYLAHLARALQGNPLVKSLKISRFRGDTRKPILLIEPSAKTKFAVRLLPALAPGALPAKYYAPGRANVKPLPPRGGAAAAAAAAAAAGGEGEEAAGAEGGATPHYTAAALEDCCFKRHLAMLHPLCCPPGGGGAFADAVRAAKVWLAQRGLRHRYDGLNGFLAAMVLLHLVQAKKVSAAADALRLFQSLLRFLAGGGLLASSAAAAAVPSLAPLQGEADVAAGREAAFRAHYPCVLLDRGAGLNVLARVSAAAAEEVAGLARVTLDLLAGGAGGHAAFAGAFLERDAVWGRYDAFVQVPCVGSADLSAAPGVDGEEDGGDPVRAAALAAEGRGRRNFPLWGALADRATQVLRRALGDRALAVVPLLGPDPEEALERGPPAWAPGEAPPPPLPLGRLTLGLRLDPAAAGRRVDRGPPAEDAAAARAFRRFWGARAELRRFKDRAIVEAVVWRQPRDGIVEEIVRWALARHDPARASGAGLVYLGSQLDPAVAEPAPPRPPPPPAAAKGGGAVAAAAAAPGHMTRRALEAFDELARRLCDLEGLPLRIAAVLPVAPGLRHTAEAPPCPHPLVPDAPADVRRQAQGQQVGTQLEALEAFVRLESSARWPGGSAEALRAAAAAFLARIGRRLQDQHAVRAAAAAGGRALDVLFRGYAFRLRLLPQPEIKALRARAEAGGGGGDPGEAAAALRTLERGSVHRALHHSAVHGFQGKHPLYAATRRALGLWLAARGFTAHVAPEAADLLAAAPFARPAPAPAPPQAALAGLLRCLGLLARHDFAAAPLVLDLQQDLTPGDMGDIQTAFEKFREEHPGKCSMYIVSNCDREQGWDSKWTDSPEPVVLRRLSAVAAAAEADLAAWLRAGGGGGGGSLAGGGKVKLPKQLFTLTAEEASTFDVIISLSPSVLRSAPASSSGGKKKAAADATEGGGKCSVARLVAARQAGCRALRTTYYKNTNPAAVWETALIGVDPVEEYVAALKLHFGKFAIFFHNGLMPKRVYVVWRPSCKIPKGFNISETKHASLSQEEDGDLTLMPNIDEILHDFKVLGDGIVDEVKLMQ